jgi:hypothetical protein
MRKTSIVLSMVLVIGALSLPILAQGSEEEDEAPELGRKYVVNLSLYYPVSINQSKHDEVNLNLGLVYSHVGYVHGFDLALLGSAIEHRLNGFQLCGLAGVVGESGAGVQIAGLATVAGESFTGVQASLLANVVGHTGQVLQVSGLANVVGQRATVGQFCALFNVAGEGFAGLQVAGGFNVGGGRSSGLQAVGLFNVVGEEFQGIQLGGLFNVVGEDLSGIQAVGLFNIAGNRCEGGQFAGLFNVVGDDLIGAQVAPFNVAVHQKGLQVGLGNVSEDNRGVQIGLVNYCKEDNDGIPIGAVNIARNGKIKGIAWGGNGVAATGGVKFEVGRYYSIVSLGFYNAEHRIAESVSYGMHYGIMFPMGKLSLGLDGGYRYRDNTPLFKNPEDQPDQHMLELRLSLRTPLSERMALFAGTGLGHSFDASSNFDSTNTYPLLFAGLEFF